MEQAQKEQSRSEFCHHLRNTLLFLGARVDVADKLEQLSAITMADVDELRRYNITLLEDIKTRLLNQSVMSICVGRPG